MPIEIEGDVFACGASWQNRLDRNVFYYFDSAGVAGDSIVGLLERSEASYAFNFEILSSWDEPTVFVVLRRLLDVIGHTIRNGFDLSICVCFRSAMEYAVVELEGPVV